MTYRPAVIAVISKSTSEITFPRDVFKTKDKHLKCNEQWVFANQILLFLVGIVFVYGVLVKEYRGEQFNLLYNVIAF